MPDSSCSYIINLYSLGLIVRDYNNEHNDVKVDGVSHGVVTLNVTVGSPADIGNVPMGVVLTTINGKKIEDTSMFSKTLKFPNKIFNIDYIGKEEVGTVKLKNEKYGAFMNGCTSQLKYK